MYEVMFVLLMLLTICIALFLVLFSFDFFYYLRGRYCRFHIGQFDNKQWENAVCKRTIKWLKKTPTVKQTDNSRYILFDMIKGIYRVGAIQSWQKASLVIGLSDYYNITIDIKDKYIDKNGNWKTIPTTVDYGMLSYSILRNEENFMSIKVAMDKMINVIMLNKDNNGLISYTNSSKSSAYYVDTLGLVCPFLSLYSRIYNESQYEDLAYRQIEFFHQYGLYKETGLPNHAIDKNSKLPIGVYGWGRGTAWYVIGLIDTYNEMVNKEYKKSLLLWIKEAADFYIKFQREDGGFGSILQRNGSYDSSVTAVFSYFYYYCFYIFNNILYKNVAERCFIKLKSVTRITGAIDWNQGDTKDIGVFAQTYDIMPFAQGMTVRAMALKKKGEKDGAKNKN